MGLGARDCRTVMQRLHEVIAAEGALLSAAAKAMGADVAIDPATLLARDGNVQRSCRLIEAQDGWLAVNLAREEDMASVPAWLGCALEDDPWDAIMRTVPKRVCAELLAQAHVLGLPVARVGEVSFDSSEADELPSSSSASSFNLTVIDLSALWAGPLCGGLLAEAGMTVTKIESPTRPDPTPMTSPALDSRINGRKARQQMALKGPALGALIDQADILITSARPHALARLGLSPDQLFARNPKLLWVAITAYGWTGEAAFRAGFGDDCAAAGGLVRWHDDSPHFLGDALADPLTGLHAARRALEAVRDGRCGLLNVGLTPTAARFARGVSIL